MVDDSEIRITEVAMEWDGGLAFRARMPDGHEIVLDGEETAPSPVEALLASIGGCMAIDVVMILEKMRIPPNRFTLELTAESMPEPPRYFRKVGMTLVLAGEGLDPAKVERAVSLSREKYCSVMLTLRPDLEVEIDCRIES